MLRIKDKSFGPRGGWMFRDDDGAEIAGGDFGELVKHVLAHRIKVGLPTENLYAIVEDGVCRQKPVKCAPPRPDQENSERKIGVADVWRFVVTLKEWLKDRTLVPQDEAERRAEICAGCRFNGDVNDGSCWGCTNIMGLVLETIADRKTRVDHALKSCKICGCFNQAQIWAPMDVLMKASGGLEMPLDTQPGPDGPIPCWKRVVA